ncbi:auxin efflux carrier [Armillaria mellea]|nr:auxin efflux carrier [Armillaria mellea]
MVSAVQLIWVSFRPLLRLVMSVLGGFVITKADIFPAAAARGAAQIALNIAMPCLMFSKMVPAFSSSNIGVLGVLSRGLVSPPISLPMKLTPVLRCLILFYSRTAVYDWRYLPVYGYLPCLADKAVFWFPHRFRYGMLAAGGWGNSGDMPTAIIMSITGAAPFNGEKDQDLAVAYISALILYYTLTFFSLGGNKLIALDFKGPDVEPEEVQESIRIRRKFLLHGVPEVLKVKVLRRASDPKDDCENQIFYFTKIRQLCHQKLSRPYFVATDSSSPPPIATIDAEDKDDSLSYPSLPTNPITHPISRQWKALLLTVRTVLESTCMPVDGYYMPSAPDGEPPLAFVIDFAEFIGVASVPLGLICLGSALARLKVPWSQWSRMPVGAILSLAAARMVVMPDDKVLQFLLLLSPDSDGASFRDPGVQWN